MKLLHLKSLNWIFLLCMMIFSLSGCVFESPPSSLRNIEHPENFRLDVGGMKGVIAFSSQCNLIKGEFNLLLYEDGSHVSHTIHIPCSDPSEDLSQPSLSFAELPVGNYDIYGYLGFQRMGDTIRTLRHKEFQSIFFKVSKNNVNYLGRFIFESGYDKHFRFAIADKHKEDFPKIYKKLVAVPKNAIKRGKISF